MRVTSPRSPASRMWRFVVCALLLSPELAFASSPTDAPGEDIAWIAEVSVLRHAVSKGDVLWPDDFSLTKLQPVAARGAMSAADLSGMEMVRSLPAGAVVRRTDVAPRQLVRRGEPVSIVVRDGALTIRMGGRALSGGGMGQRVRVVGQNAGQTMDGVVDGPGTVRIVAP